MSRSSRIPTQWNIWLALVAIVLMASYGLYRIRTGGKLEQRLEKLRAAGEPVSFADLAPGPVDPKEDAAAQLATLTPQLTAFAKEHVAFLSSTPLGDSFRGGRERGEAPTMEQVDAIRQILSHYPNLAKAIDMASRCEGYASPIDYDVPDSQVVNEITSLAKDRRTFARFLSWQITVLLADGQRDEAVETGLVILRLARHFDHEPGLVNTLISIALRAQAAEDLNRVLRAGPVGETARKHLDEELHRHEDLLRFRRAWQTERVVNLSASQSVGPGGLLSTWFTGGMAVDMLDYYESAIPVLCEPWYVSHDKVRDLASTASTLPSVSGRMLALLTPAIESTYVAYHRNIAVLRSLRIVNALTAYAQRHGHEASGLDALDLPDSVTVDPFSGERLRLRMTDNGWVVYTVFTNVKDDGGDFRNQADWGLGPWPANYSYSTNE